MVYNPVSDLDQAKIQQASETLCRLFNIPSLRDYQEKAGQNILQGHNTFLDIPTGGGKTLAFYYPLFYHWTPGNSNPACQKVLLVLGPLTSLLQAQAEALTEIGVPAVALAGELDSLDSALKDFGLGKYRVGFVSPELALKPKFHQAVLEQSAFQDNIIGFIVDEGHNITEWGTDDFRPDYARLSSILGRLPANLPILVASATVPPEVIDDIQDKLGMGKDCKMISVSNEKANVSLSVRIMQHPQDSYADLLALFPSNPSETFPQTLIYVNSRTEAERIQDFLRENCPKELDKFRFEFYHRFIDGKRKKIVETGLREGTLSGVPATDALGMGLDFRGILRVILWGVPLTFNSLIQKIGRCVRIFTQLGEAILFLTKTAYNRCLTDFDPQAYANELKLVQFETDPAGSDGESHRSDSDGDKEEEEEEELNIELGPETTQQEPHAAIRPTRFKKSKRRKVLSRVEQRDQWYLYWFIVTTECRRIPWNEYYKNYDKAPSPFPVPEERLCCDNCSPDKFPVPNIQLIDPYRLQPPGRRRKDLDDSELEDDLRDSLKDLRDQIVSRRFPNQFIITGKMLIDNTVIESLVSRARVINSVGTLKQRVNWAWADECGDEVVEKIVEVVARYPDHHRIEQERLEREKQVRIEQQQLRSELSGKLAALNKQCLDAVDGPTLGPFKRRPRKDKYPDYEVIIGAENVVTTAIISARISAKMYNSVSQWAQDWYRLFRNARTYNVEGSGIYSNSIILCESFKQAFREAAPSFGWEFIDDVVADDDSFEIVDE